MINKKEVIIFGILIFLVGIVSASDYKFQDASGNNLTIIHGDTGNLSVKGNISAERGFFGWIGTLTSRVTKLFVTDIDANGVVNFSDTLLVNNVNASQWLFNQSEASNGSWTEARYKLIFSGDFKKNFTESFDLNLSARYFGNFSFQDFQNSFYNNMTPVLANNFNRTEFQDAFNANITNANIQLSELNVTNVLRVGSTSLHATTSGINITGETNFNGRWADGGVTINGGNIWAQVLYVYNITSVGVSNLYINGSQMPSLNNTWDLGNETLNWRTAYFSNDVFISGVPNGGGAKQYLYNQTLVDLRNFQNSFYNNITPVLANNFNRTEFQTAFINNLSIYSLGNFSTQQFSDAFYNNMTPVLANNFNRTEFSGAFQKNFTDSFKLNFTDSFNTNISVFNNTLGWNVSATSIYQNDLTKKVGIGVTNATYTLEIKNNATALNVSGNLYVNESRIGIGTSTPRATLDVQGDIWIKVNNGIIFGDSVTNYQSIKGDTGGEILRYNSYTAHNFSIQNSQKMLLNANGLGIGITIPSAKLHVVGTGDLLNISNVSTPIFKINETGINANVSFYAADNFFANSTSVGIGTLKPKYSLEIANSATALNVSGNLYANQSTIWTTGNVGIGTTSPVSSAKIQVNVGTDMNLAIQQATNDGGTIITGVKLNAFNDAGNAATLMQFGGSSFTWKIVQTEKMTLNETGRLGIGTTSPKYLLEIKNNETALNVSGMFYANTSLVWTNGKIGIGNSNPKYSLEINNSDVSLNVSGMLYANSTNVGVGTTLNSVLLQLTGVGRLLNISNSSTSIFKINETGINANVSLYVKEKEVTNYNDYQSLTIDDSGLMGYWRFEEGTGTTVYDSSAFDNNGTFSGAPVWTTSGKYGKALNFDGDDDYITMPDSSSLDVPGAITISVWMKSGFLVGGNGGLVSKGPNTAEKYFAGAATTSYMLGIYANAMYFKFSDGATAISPACPSTSLIDGNWHHVVATWDGTTSTNGAKLYFDNVLTCSANSTITSIQNLNSVLDIGGYTTSYNFNGSIDEVMILNRSMSQQEVTNLYNARKVSLQYNENVMSYTAKQNLNMNAKNILNAGKIGVGTSTPSYSLEVKNNATALNVSGNLYANTSNVWIMNDLNVSGNLFIYGINASQWLFNQSSGNNSWTEARYKLIFTDDFKKNFTDSFKLNFSESFKLNFTESFANNISVFNNTLGWNVSGTNVYAKSTGYKVGIGTTDVTYPLTVQSTNANGQIMIGDTDMNVGGRLAYDNGGSTILGIYNSYSSSTNSSIHFGFGNSTPTATYPVVSIKAGKKVGINTDAPAYSLEINNSATALNVSGHLYVNSSSIGVGTSVPTAKMDIVSTELVGLLIRTGVASGNLALKVDSMYDQGNEGMPTGTGAETAVFKRNANSAYGAAIAIVGGSASTADIYFGDKDDIDVGKISYSHSTNAFSFTENTLVKQTFTSAGRVGIGVTAPAYLLEIKNNETALNVSGNLYANSSSVGIGTKNSKYNLEIVSSATALNVSGNLFVDSSGVGIGVTAPAYLLEVADSDAALNVSGNLYVNTSTTWTTGNVGIGNGILESWGDNYPTLQIGGRGGIMGEKTGSGLYLINDLYFNNSNWIHRTSGSSGSYISQYLGDIRFNFANGTGKIAGDIATNLTHMVIRGDGKVGIGVLSPKYLLEISNNETSLNVSGMLYANSTNVGIGIFNSSYWFEVGNASGSIFFVNSTDVRIKGVAQFADVLVGDRGAPNNSNYDVMTINRDNMTGPAAIQFYISNGTSGLIGVSSASGILADKAIRGDFVMRTTNINNSLIFATGAIGAGVERMRVNGTTGNVGIGVSNPFARLETYITNGSIDNVFAGNFTAKNTQASVCTELSSPTDCSTYGTEGPCTSACGCSWNVDVCEGTHDCSAAACNTTKSSCVADGECDWASANSYGIYATASTTTGGNASAGYFKGDVVIDNGVLHGQVDWIYVPSLTLGSSACNNLDTYVSGYSYTCKTCRGTGGEGTIACGDSTTPGVKNCACQVD